MRQGSGVPARGRSHMGRGGILQTVARLTGAEDGPTDGAREGGERGCRCGRCGRLEMLGGDHVIRKGRVDGNAAGSAGPRRTAGAGGGPQCAVRRGRGTDHLPHKIGQQVLPGFLWPERQADDAHPLDARQLPLGLRCAELRAKELKRHLRPGTKSWEMREMTARASREQGGPVVREAPRSRSQEGSARCGAA